MPFACSFSPLWIYSLLTASVFGCIVALHVEWTQLPDAGRISPRRSGHTAFVAAGGEQGPLRPFVFGGYVEVENDNDDAEKAPYKRFVTNDLWEWKKQSNKWEPVETTVTANDKGKDDDGSNMPGPRLVAATAVLEDKVYLFGGWDPSPQAVQAGKFILDTVHVLENLSSGQRCWSRLPVTIPDGPISRHVAVSLASRQQILIHSHRCQDYVLLFDPKTLKFTKQPTTGPCPSSRGLHAATVLHSKNENGKKDIVTSERLVFFGGAAQDQTMSNEAFLLDTATWEWKKLLAKDDKKNDNDDAAAAPSPRAAPCLCAISDDCVILFGGAKSTDTGLEPLQDLWALHVTENQWEQLIPPPPPSSTKDDIRNDYCCPPPRNAATLTPCSLASSSNDDENDVQTFMLTGGWAPFKQTWDDCYILHVYTNKD